jgi:hypothetical protein
MQARVLEWLGRRLRFSPEGRRVRVWLEGWPGEEDSRVVEATVLGRSGPSAVLELDAPALVAGRELQFARVTPRERGFGLDALWFSFIAVDASDPDTGDPLGRWAIRLGSRA